jgi:hypothetical protein
MPGAMQLSLPCLGAVRPPCVPVTVTQHDPPPSPPTTKCNSSPAFLFLSVACAARAVGENLHFPRQRCRCDAGRVLQLHPRLITSSTGRGYAIPLPRIFQTMPAISAGRRSAACVGSRSVPVNGTVSHEILVDSLLQGLPRTRARTR